MRSEYKVSKLAFELVDQIAEKIGKIRPTSGPMPDPEVTAKAIRKEFPVGDEWGTRKGSAYKAFCFEVRRYCGLVLRPRVAARQDREAALMKGEESAPPVPTKRTKKGTTIQVFGPSRPKKKARRKKV